MIQSTKQSRGNWPKHLNPGISEQIPDNIKRVSRCIGYAAWLDAPEAWLGLATVLSARLEPHQRAAMAYAALRTLSPEHASMTAELAIYGPHVEEIAA